MVGLSMVSGVTIGFYPDDRNTALRRGSLTALPLGMSVQHSSRV